MPPARLRVNYGQQGDKSDKNTDIFDQDATSQQKNQSPEMVMGSKALLLDVDKPLMSLTNINPDKENRFKSGRNLSSNYTNYVNLLNTNAKKLGVKKPYSRNVNEMNANVLDTVTTQYKTNPSHLIIEKTMTNPFNNVRNTDKHEQILLAHNALKSRPLIESGRKTSGQPETESHHRQKRGFRSAVVDRIAHGFGKRTAAHTSEPFLPKVRNKVAFTTHMMILVIASLKSESNL